MVSPTMGLLEEAIREHFDLRRRRGADPEEVAREELDALTPVELDQGAQRSSASADASERDDPGDGAAGRAPFEGREPLDDRRQRITGSDTKGKNRHSLPRDASFMEETAEIDMRTVLGELEQAMSGEEAGGDAHVRRAMPVESTPPVAAGGSRAAFDYEVDDHLLAWETPAPRVRRADA